MLCFMTNRGTTGRKKTTTEIERYKNSQPQTDSVQFYMTIRRVHNKTIEIHKIFYLNVRELYIMEMVCVIAIFQVQINDWMDGYS